MSNRWTMAVVALTFWVISPASAEDQNPSDWLFPKRGDVSTRPDAVVLMAEWNDLPTSAPEAVKPKPLIAFLTKTTLESEKLLRRKPGPGATNAQRESMARECREKIEEKLRSMLGEYVTATIVIEDVVPFQMPRSEGNDADGFSGYMVFGVVERKSSPELSENEKEKLRAIELAYNAELKRIKEMGTTYQVENGPFLETRNTVSSQERQELRKKAREKQEREKEAVVDEAKARIPDYRVYCLSEDPSLLEWKRNQRRNVKGFVFKMGGLPEPAASALLSDEMKSIIEERSDSPGYLRLEVVLRLLNESDDPGNDTVQPKE